MNLDLSVNLTLNNLDDLAYYVKPFLEFDYNGFHVNFFYKKNYVDIWFYETSIVYEITPENDYMAPQLKEAVNIHQVIEDLNRTLQKK